MDKFEACIGNEGCGWVKEGGRIGKIEGLMLARRLVKAVIDDTGIPQDFDTDDLLEIESEIRLAIENKIKELQR